MTKAPPPALNRFLSGWVGQSPRYGFPPSPDPGAPHDVAPRRRRPHGATVSGFPAVPADVPPGRGDTPSPATASSAADGPHRPGERPGLRRTRLRRTRLRRTRLRRTSAGPAAQRRASRSRVASAQPHCARGRVLPRLRRGARLCDRRRQRVEHDEREQPLPVTAAGAQHANGNGSSSGNRQNSSIDVNGIAGKVSPSIVNFTSSLDQGEAAGTGILISSSGLVLTNNHVIASANQLEAEIGGDGSQHPAKVLGYDIQSDVALVQIEGVSGLDAASLGNSSSAQIGDAIVAMGNAGGKGGAPSVVSGTVTGLDQQITASDQDGSDAETLARAHPDQRQHPARRLRRPARRRQRQGHRHGRGGVHAATAAASASVVAARTRATPSRSRTRSPSASRSRQATAPTASTWAPTPASSG